MGTQLGRITEIFTSFELSIEKDIVNADFLVQRSSQIHECYPSYTVLGWYFVGSEVNSRIMSIHHQISTITECKLLCLMFDEIQEREEKQFTLYELVDEKFNRIPYKTEALEPERVSVECLINNYSGADNTVNTVFSQHIRSLRSVLQMIKEHIGIVQQFLKQEKQASLRPNSPRHYQILRQISGFIKAVPTATASLENAEQASLEKSTQTALSILAQSSEGGLSASFLQQAEDASLSHAFLSEYAEAAIIVALARMGPLMQAWQSEESHFRRLQHQYQAFVQAQNMHARARKMRADHYLPNEDMDNPYAEISDDDEVLQEVMNKSILEQ